MDFMIPCHPKDIDTVMMSVECLHSMKTCGNVYVISPVDMNIPETIHVSDHEFDSYFTVSDIHERWTSEYAPLAHRSHWLYQQFLKLYSFKVLDEISETYVAVDADTMFVRNVSFDETKFQYCVASEYHQSYLRTYEKIMKNPPQTTFSFISHHMMFKKSYLEELINHIEMLHNKSFVDAVLDNIDYRENSTFSEWDLYGNWMYNNHPDICENRQLCWRDIPCVPTKSTLDQYAATCDLVSAHAWIRGVE